MSRLQTGTQGHAAESALNLALVDQLRRQGIEARADRKLRSDGEWRTHDVLIELGKSAVALRAEFESARTDRMDALERSVDPPPTWRGLPVGIVLYVILPAHLKNMSERDASKALAGCDSLEFGPLWCRTALNGVPASGVLSNGEP